MNWVVVRLEETIRTMQATVNLAELSADVAHVFHPSAWGWGDASEALAALLKFLHENLSVERFKANIDTQFGLPTSHRKAWVHRTSCESQVWMRVWLQSAAKRLTRR